MRTVKNKPAMLTLALLGTFLAPAVWACKVPATPNSIPDGRKAEKEVMLEAKRKVEQYLEHVHVYTDCENDGLKLQEVMAARKLVMDRFNAEVRAFRAVNRE